MFRQQREKAAASKKFYKQGLDEDDLKKRREDKNFSVRKKNRMEQIRKKRQMETREDDGSAGLFSSNDIRSQLAQLPATVAQLKSHDASERNQAVVALRRLLSIEKNPPIEEVIKAGAIPPLVTVLNQDPDQTNQFESAWALTNVASGSTEHTHILLQNQGAEAFIGKISTPTTSLVKEQSIWALGNIAGDSHTCRDHLLHLGAMRLLLNETGDDVKPSLRRNVVWAISNLCRGKPAPPFQAIQPAIPILAKLLTCSDTNVITDACWALSYISDGDDETRINQILRSGVQQIAVTLLNHQAASVQTPALRVIGNIVTGDEIQTQAAITSGCLPALKMMLDTSIKKSIKREVCWTLSNITAGSQSQIQAVLDAQIVDSLIYNMKESEFDVKKEAAWAIANATSSGSPDQIKELVSKGCMAPLCDLVIAPDVRVVAVSLEGLENILRNGESLKADNRNINPYAEIIEKTGGLVNIHSLTQHPSTPIYEKAKNIIFQYFNEEGAQAAQEGFGNVANSAGFSF